MRISNCGATIAKPVTSRAEIGRLRLEAKNTDVELNAPLDFRTFVPVESKKLFRQKPRLDLQRPTDVARLAWEGWCTGPTDTLRAAVAIDGQIERWSCGPNAAARAMAALGQSVNFPKFLEDCPRHFTLPLIAGVTETGPLPGELCGYVNKQLKPDYTVRLVETADGGEALRQLRACLRRGVPAVCLLTFADLSMHYVTAIGWKDCKIAFLNNNQGCYWLNEEEFLAQMNSHDSLVHRLGKIRAYNMLCFGTRHHDDVLTPSGLTVHEPFCRAVHDDLRAHPKVVEHYWHDGLREGRCASPWFDVKYYMAHNPDVSRDPTQATLHYVEYGVYEGRNASPYFSPRYYLAMNPDVAAVYGSRNVAAAVAHWCRFGISEGRPGSPLCAELRAQKGGNKSLFENLIEHQRAVK